MGAEPDPFTGLLGFLARVAFSSRQRHGGGSIAAPYARRRCSMRFLRHTMFSLVLATLAALALGVPPVAAKLTLQDVGLSCSDGTALNLALSPTEVLDLLGAVLAINSFPAGDPPLACSLSGDPPGSGNPQHDSAVGGGTLQALGACHDSFALS